MPFVIIDTNGNIKQTAVGAISTTGVSSIAGTANQVIANASTGNITLSTPQDIATISTPEFSGVKLKGSGSGDLTIKSPSTASGTLTFPAGTTDFSATGGTSKFLKQASTGAAITVVQPTSSDLSDSSNIPLLNATNHFTSSGVQRIDGILAVDNDGSLGSAGDIVLLNNVALRGINNAGSGARPLITIDTADKINIGNSDAIKLNGDVTTSASATVGTNFKTATSQNFSWNSKSFGTVYQAASDGFVVANINITVTNQSGVIIGYTDSSNPPTTQRCGAEATSISSSIVDNAGFTMPVKKGDYWEVTQNGVGPTYTLFWVPLGTSG